MQVVTWPLIGVPASAAASGARRPGAWRSGGSRRRGTPSGCPAGSAVPTPAVVDIDCLFALHGSHRTADIAAASSSWCSGGSSMANVSMPRALTNLRPGLHGVRGAPKKTAKSCAVRDVVGLKAFQAHRRQGCSARRPQARGAGGRRQRREHQPPAVQWELVVAPVQREVHLHASHQHLENLRTDGLQ